MKQLLAAAFAAATLSAFAACERIGSFQLADTATQGEACAKLGSFVGNPLASAGMAAALADNPLIKFFGPMREKSATVFVFFFETDELAKGPSEAFDSLEFAVLYPFSLSKEEFLKRAGAVETNGVFAVKWDLFSNDEYLATNETTYVAFSPDGKWAGASDKAAQAKLALAEIAVAEKPMDGDVVRLRVDEKAIKAASSAARRQREKGEDVDPSLLEMLESLKAVACGLRISDLGVDVRGSAKFVDGSEASKCGLKALGADPLAFAGKSILACAQAEDCGSRSCLTEKEFNDYVALFKKHGFDIGKYVAFTKTPEAFRFVLDLPLAIKAAQAAANEKPAPIPNPDKFMEEALKITNGKPFTAKSPAYAVAFDIKGFESQWPVQERFAATMPKAGETKPYAVGFCSFSSVFKAVVANAAQFVSADELPMYKPIFDSIAESKCGSAWMQWRKDDTHRFFLRFSADECRSLGTLLFMGVQSSFSAPYDDDDDGGDDDDESDD